MAIPALRTWNSGELASASELNSNIRDAGQFILFPPYLQLVLGTALSVAASAWTLVTWDTELVNTDNMHNTTLNPSRITASTGGRYDFTICLRFTAVASTDNTARGLMLRLNSAGSPTGGTLLLDAGATASGAASVGNAVTIETTVESGIYQALNSGDYVEVFAWQSTAAALTLVPMGGAIPGEMETFLTAKWFAVS